MAELLCHVLSRAVLEVLAPPPVLHMPRRDADLSPAEDEAGLPLPMIPGNAATPTTLCAIEVSHCCRRRRRLGREPRRPAACRAPSSKRAGLYTIAAAGGLQSRGQV